MKPLLVLPLLLISSAGLRGVELPVTFEANRGQFPPAVHYAAHSSTGNLYIGSGEVTIFPAGRTRPLSMRWQGGRAVEPTGFEPLATVSNYLDHTPQRGPVLGAPHFGRVVQREVYPGIDVVYRVDGNRVEFDLHAAPGADPGRALLAWEGADSVKLDAAGNLEVTAGNGHIVVRKPISYQMDGERRQAVESAFRLLSGNRAGFRVGAYDRSRELVVDPALTWGARFGGSSYDYVTKVARDVAGYLYVVGYTFSSDWGTPLGPGAFAVKMNPTNPPSLGSIVYKNFFGQGQTNAVAVDEAGNAYLTGYTTGLSFPVTGGAYQINPGGGIDAFYAAVDPFGSLTGATLLGGSGNDVGNAIVLGHDGLVAIAGYTSSATITTSADAPQRVFGGFPSDAFMVKFNAAATERPYFTYLGGAGNDSAQSLKEFSLAGTAAAESGSLYVLAGYTESAGFPTTTGAFQTTRNGTSAGFLTGLTTAPAATPGLRFSTYYGGNAAEQLNDIQNGPNGDLVSAGVSTSSTIPVTAGTPANCCGAQTGILSVWSVNGAFKRATRPPVTGEDLDALTGAHFLPNGDIAAAGRIGGTVFGLPAGFIGHGAVLVWSSFLTTLKDKLDLGAGISPFGASLSLFPDTALSVGGTINEGRTLLNADLGQLVAGGLLDGFAAIATLPSTPLGPKLKVTTQETTDPLLLTSKGRTFNIIVSNVGDQAANNVRVIAAPRGTSLSGYTISGELLIPLSPFVAAGRLTNCNGAHTVAETPDKYCTAAVLNQTERLSMTVTFPFGAAIEKNAVIVSSTEAYYETAEPAAVDAPPAGSPNRSRYSLGAAGGIEWIKTATAGQPVASSAAFAHFQVRAQSSGSPIVSSLQLTVDPNQGAAARTGAGTVNGVLVSIWQAAAGCDFQLSTQSNTVPATGGEFTVDVTTTAGCQWVPATNNSFITFVLNGNGATGSSTLRYRVAQNGSGSPRSASIRVAGKSLQILQAAPVPSSFFTDVPAAYSFFNHTALMSLGGITLGCAPAAYCPDSVTTRGQMAVFLVRAVVGGDEFAFNSQPFFTDVPATHGFFKWIQKLKELGVTAGCVTDHYCPDDAVTRGQMAAFVVRASLLITASDAFPFPAAQTFADVPPSNGFYSYIQKMKETGVTLGCAVNAYCPNDPVTRGQMSAFIVRMLAR